MSTEIIRARSNSNGVVRRSDARSTMDAALAKLRGGEIVRRSAPVDSLSCRQSSAEIVDLPRYCAVHDRGYVARYVLGSDGRYQYSQSIRFAEGLQDQYRSEAAARGIVADGQYGFESCPWCGASGFGAVRCKQCKANICVGKTVGDCFKCRPSCGCMGKIVRNGYDSDGISPGLDAPRAPSSY